MQSPPQAVVSAKLDTSPPLQPTKPKQLQGVASNQSSKDIKAAPKSSKGRKAQQIEEKIKPEEANGGKKAPSKKDSNGSNWKLLLPQQINYCLKTEIKTKTLNLQEELLTQGREGCSYHKLREDLKFEGAEGGDLERLQSAIEDEIENTKVELKEVVQELMECEAIKLVAPSDTLSKDMIQNLPQSPIQSLIIWKIVMIKIKNQLSVNFVTQTLMEKEKLTPQFKEELKETIIEKMDKQFMPNFINEDTVQPADSKRFVPQDPNSIAKPYMIKNPQQSLTLENSYITELPVQSAPLLQSIKASLYPIGSQKPIADLVEPSPYLVSTEFDFKPVNPNLLLLSRLEFLTKHRQIHTYMKRQYHRRKQEIDVAQNQERNY